MIAEATSPVLLSLTVELAAKRIQLLKEVVPPASCVAILWNPNNSINKLELNEARAAGNTLGLTLLPIEIPPPKISKAHSAQ
jgi:putative ABC transport system substrate-binding protein